MRREPAAGLRRRRRGGRTLGAALCLLTLWSSPIANAQAPQDAPLPQPSPQATAGAGAPGRAPLPVPRPGAEPAPPGPASADASAPAAAPRRQIPPASAAAAPEPERPAEADARRPSAVAIAPVPPPRSGLRGSTLIGIFALTTGRTALMRFPSGEVRRLSVGDEIDGWRVDSIASDAIRVTRNGRDRTFLLIGN